MTDSQNAEPGDSAEQSATDDAALGRLRRFGGGKLLDEMIGLFVSTAPDRIQAARTGVDTANVAAAEMALHSLKSSSAQLGAMQMQRLSERGEQLARSGTLDGVDRIVADLEEEFARVQTWLGRSRTVEAK
ncbi:MAG: Hpt domain-containing protein [Polaromonas sp.]|nr:Hpt domain-containing protein [Gemmatimonadaceae bacterium]